MDKDILVARIDALLATPWDRPTRHSIVAQMVQGTVTVLEAVHGSGCRQIELLRSRVTTIEEGTKNSLADQHIEHEVFDTARGALQNVKAEIEAGFLGTLARSITGEVLSDFIQLANTVLQSGDANAKDVAAVLAAAAFEDTIRKMGVQFCGIQTRDALSDIAIALKQKGILVGSQFGTVQAQLQFRNDALHADWGKIDTVGVRTVLQLVQELLLKHFG
jgi:hypothetical protein